MKICGACERELPRESFSGKQWRIRKSLRRCIECVAAGNELALFTKGRVRSEDDECPICSMLLPIADNETLLHSCCMKTVCIGCQVAARKRGMGDKCPFCRTPLTRSDEVQIARIQKRVKANDPEAIHHLGNCYRHWLHGLEKDVPKAIELFERAAELGIKDAHFKLGIIFDECCADEGIDKNTARAVKHYEIAAKLGHVEARHNLGVSDYLPGSKGFALKHFMISAKLGEEQSLKNVKTMYTEGEASKSDYAEALRGYHDAVKEMSNPERDEAKEYFGIPV